MELISTYQGSVNRWECDENDHQNVRFYLTKLHQGLAIGLQKLCITDHAGAVAALDAVTSHHIRFVREARMAAPQVIQCGVLNYVPDTSLTLLSLMQNTATQELQAAFVTELSLTGLQVDPPSTPYVMLPEEAQPRGVAATTSPYARLDYPQALALGFVQVGAGIIGTDECNAHGTMGRQYFMGRMSDGMPNLWAYHRPPGSDAARGEGEIGGAVLEYRQEFHAKLTAGDSFVHLAGVHTLGNKTKSICHLIYAASSGALVASAEALGISMDLSTRRSIAIPAAERAHIETLILRAPAG